MMHEELYINMPGKFSIYNALAAAGVCIGFFCF